ncbi:MAG: hypothetical protein JXX29_06945 [Deltaproteobacteria bacterium]|nr:hypothetical protein [Deltaproteobacteria bacterium]MBN2671390.1 hypothetical protein [Deltaproteobacteria bacterium]
MKIQSYVWFMVLVLSFSGVWGCDDGGADEDTDSSIDTGVPDDSDTGDTDTGTDTEVESEIPPQLPSLCSASVSAAFLSGGGDGRMPTISAVSESDALVAYAYDPQEDGSTSRIQLATYDDDAAEYVSYTLFEDSIVSSEPRMTNNGTGYALVWLEGRTEWDAGCLTGASDDCRVDVALTTIDSGVSNESVPVRVSQEGVAQGRPAVVPVSTGWLAIWGESNQGDVSVVAAHVSAAGTVGAVQDISGDNFADEVPRISAAVVDDTVLVLWRGSSQRTLYYRMLNITGQSLGETQILFDGETAYQPVAAADTVGFMVAYGRWTQNDGEIFTRRIDVQGTFVGTENRITWTNTVTRYASLAFVPGKGFAIGWLSDTANGSSSCVDSVCAAKVFGSVLNDDGSLAAEPIMLSDGADDLNPCKELTIGTNGTDWLVTYELRRNLRQQLAYSVFSCQ